LGLVFVLCGGGEGDEEEDDRGVDEMAHGGFLCVGICEIKADIFHMTFARRHHV
jgi:hypothetical protein